MPLFPYKLSRQNPTPADFGYLAWTYDANYAAAAFTLTPAGTVYTARMYIYKPMTITNIIYFITTTGNTLTAGQCFLGLYNSAGTLLSSTADQAANFAGTGVKTAALTAAQAVGIGFVDIGVFYNGTTGPSFPRLANLGVNNVGLTSQNIRYATADTGRTTSLATPLGAKSASSGSALWFAVS